MKTITVAAVITALGLGLGAHAGAQPRTPSDAPTTPPRTTAREAWKNTEGLVESNKLIGTRVKSPEGKDIGEIDRLMIDPKTGRVGYAVIGVGGVVGIGEKHVIVPWSQVASRIQRADRDRVTVTMDQQTLEQAPRFEAREAGTERERTSPSASPPTGQPYTTPAPR